MTLIFPGNIFVRPWHRYTICRTEIHRLSFHWYGYLIKLTCAQPQNQWEYITLSPFSGQKDLKWREHEKESTTNEEPLESAMPSVSGKNN